MADMSKFSPDEGQTIFDLKDRFVRPHIEQFVRDTVGFTGKNLIKNVLVTTTHYGCYFGLNLDGSVLVNGTPTQDLYIQVNRYDAPGKYILNGISQADGGSNFRMQAYIYNSENIFQRSYTDIGSGVEVTINDNEYANIQIVVTKAGGNVDHKVVYPMLRHADITDPTYEPYHDSVEVTFEEELHGVNLLPNNAPGSKTQGGITITKNSDNSFTSSAGTPSENVNGYYLAEGMILPKGTYIFSGLPSNLANLHAFMEIKTGGWVGTQIANLNINNPTAKFTLTEDTAIYVRPYINSGTAQPQMTWYPMLRKADIDDPTYRPYNPQAIQNQLNAETGVLGVRNLLPNNATNSTINGITYTVNSDGTVIADGTATADAYLAWDTGLSINTEMNEISAAIAKGYKISGCPDASASKYFVGLSSANRAYIVIKNGTKVTNKKFYPMIRLASDPDDTYAPYAMTNRELTEKVETLKSVRTWDSTTGIVLFKYGNIVTVNFDAMTAVTKGADEVFFTLPEGYRPRDIIQFVEPLNNRRIVISTNGQISSKIALENTYIRGYATFIVM